MIWIIGEYAERIDNADELLESFLETFPEEVRGEVSFVGIIHHVPIVHARRQDVTWFGPCLVLLSRLAVLLCLSLSGRDTMRHALCFPMRRSRRCSCSC